jgi:uncharacterized delta-60 repeat protein
MGVSRIRTRVAAVIATTVLLAAVGAAPVHAATNAAPPSLDPTFGDAGRVIAKPPTEPGKSQFEAMAREPDGNLVLSLRREPVAGYLGQEIEMRDPTGALVPSFGSGGKLVVQSGFYGLVATLADGNSLVGVTSCGGEKSSVEMLDPSGALVAGFGRGGCGPLLSAEPEFATTDAQGRILLAGTSASCAPRCYHDVGPVSEVMVARLLPDGSPDPSFGKSGVVNVYADDAIHPEPYFGTRPYGLVALPDGAVQIAASGGLIRLEADGAAAPGFKETGVVAPLPIEGEGAYVRPGGGVLVAEVSEDKKAVLVRKLGPDGAADPAFGAAGIARIPVPKEHEVGQVVEGPGGSVTVSIAPWRSRLCLCGQGLILARLTQSGQLDPSYGKEGIVNLPPTPARILHPYAPTVNALIVAGDGSTIVAGADPNEQGSVSVLTAAGAPDPAFGRGGTATEELEEPVQLGPTGLTVGPDGTLEVMNRRANLAGLDAGFLLAFDDGGRQQPLGTGSASVETPFHGQLVQDGGGRLVVWDEGDRGRTLRALDPAGAPLPAYGKKGVAKLPKAFRPEVVVPVPGKGVVAIGSVKAGDMAVYRLDAMGRAVAGFGRHGLDVVRFPGASSGAFAGLVEADGDIVITGWAGDHVGAARLRPGGRLDPSFGRGGLVRGLLTPRKFGPIGVQIAPLDGGYVIGAGEERNANFDSAGLIHLDRHGHLDRSFGRAGVAYQGARNPPMAVFTARGKIFVVTDPLYERGRPHSRRGGILLWAYRPDGSTDRSFGRHGELLAGAGGAGSGLSPDLAVQQPDGKIVVAGTLKVGEETKLELLRFPLPRAS